MSAEWPLLVAGAAAAGFVQGVTGFGFAMVAMSFWAWGVEPQVAAVMAVSGSVFGQLLQLLAARRRLDAAALWPFLAGGLLGVPLGAWALPSLDPVLFRLFIGTLLMVFCPAMLLSDRLPRLTAGGRAADGLVGAVGGVLSGLGGFSGVLPALWCTLRGFDKDLQRSVIQNFNLAVLSATLGSYVLSGAFTAAMLPTLAVVLPSVVLPSLLGAGVHARLSPAAFRRLVLVMLTAAGMAMVWAALPQWAARGG